MSAIVEYSELKITSMSLPQDVVPLMVNLRHVCLARAHMSDGREVGTRIFLINGSTVVLDVDCKTFKAKWSAAVEGGRG